MDTSCKLLPAVSSRLFHDTSDPLIGARYGLKACAWPPGAGPANVCTDQVSSPAGVGHITLLPVAVALSIDDIDVLQPLVDVS